MRKSTIELRPHPEEILELSPEAVEKLKKLLKEEYKLTEEEIQRNLDQDYLER